MPGAVTTPSPVPSCPGWREPRQPEQRRGKQGAQRGHPQCHRPPAGETGALLVEGCLGTGPALLLEGLEKCLFGFNYIAYASPT